MLIKKKKCKEKTWKRRRIASNNSKQEPHTSCGSLVWSTNLQNLTFHLLQKLFFSLNLFFSSSLLFFSFSFFSDLFSFLCSFVNLVKWPDIFLALTRTIFQILTLTTFFQCHPIFLGLEKERKEKKISEREKERKQEGNPVLKQPSQ